MKVGAHLTIGLDDVLDASGYVDSGTGADVDDLGVNLILVAAGDDDFPRAGRHAQIGSAIGRMYDMEPTRDARLFAVVVRYAWYGLIGW